MVVSYIVYFVFIYLKNNGKSNCELIGPKWHLSNKKTISVYRLGTYLFHLTDESNFCINNDKALVKNYENAVELNGNKKPNTYTFPYHTMKYNYHKQSQQSSWRRQEESSTKPA